MLCTELTDGLALTDIQWDSLTGSESGLPLQRLWSSSIVLRLDGTCRCMVSILPCLPLYRISYEIVGIELSTKVRCLLVLETAKQHLGSCRARRDVAVKRFSIPSGKSGTTRILRRRRVRTRSHRASFSCSPVYGCHSCQSVPRSGRCVAQTIGA